MDAIVLISICAGMSYNPVRLSLSKRWNSLSVAELRLEQPDGGGARVGNQIRVPGSRLGHLEHHVTAL